MEPSPQTKDQSTSTDEPFIAILLNFLSEGTQDKPYHMVKIPGVPAPFMVLKKSYRDNIKYHLSTASKEERMRVTTMEGFDTLMLDLDDSVARILSKAPSARDQTPLNRANSRRAREAYKEALARKSK